MTTTFLLYDDSYRSRELRHEIGLNVGDPVPFIEFDGRRIVITRALDAPLFSAREDVIDEVWLDHELGSEDLVRDPSIPEHLAGAEILARALTKLGVSTVTVPPTFRVGIADYLRDKGIEVVVDPVEWTMRRRRKSYWELEGIERAQRAVDTAMLTAARMLREAEPTAQGQLRFEGEVLTSELIREAMSAELLQQGAESDEIIVASGPASVVPHDYGTGPILPDQPCIVDCFPRDLRTGVHTDMTRTFVPGTPSEELTRLYVHCKAAFEIAMDAAQPGRADVYSKVVEYFHSNGLPTLDHHTGGDPLEEGFIHGLGHGVGLDVHEPPRLSRRSDELVVGDVVTIEPGLYFKGIGGVRLEDTVLITDEGAEPFTDPYSYDLTP